MNKFQLRQFVKRFALSLFGEKITKALHQLSRIPARCYRKSVLPVFRYIATRGYRSKNVALGERREYKFPSSWIMLDLFNSDININFKHRNRLPFKDQSKAVFYTAHMLEHIGYESGEFLLREVFRVLQPGGWLRIEVPDAKIFLDKYKANDREFIDHFVNYNRTIVKRFSLAEDRIVEDHISVMNGVSHYYPVMKENGALYSTNVAIPVYIEKDIFDKKMNTLSQREFFEWAASLQTEEQLETCGHQCGYSYEILKSILGAIGFTNIMQMSYGESIIPNLNLKKSSIDKKTSIDEKQHRLFFSLYVDAQKPE